MLSPDEKIVLKRLIEREEVLVEEIIFAVINIDREDKLLHKVVEDFQKIFIPKIDKL